MNKDRLKPKEESIEDHLVMAQSLSNIAPLGSVSAYLTFTLGFLLALNSLFSPGLVAYIALSRLTYTFYSGNILKYVYNSLSFPLV